MRHQQFFVALFLCTRIGLARRGFAHGRSPTLDHRFLHAHAIVEVDRIHFAEHLAGTDSVANLDFEPLQTPCAGRADLVEVARLDRADAEQGRRDRPRLLDC